MSTPFTASTGGDSKKLEVEKIPTGMRLCTFHSLVDIGTQDGGQYGPKHKVYLGFEFPQEMRVFWEGDEAKPCNIWTMQTLSMNEKANLRKEFIEPMLGRKLSDEEAEKFDLSSLLGKNFIATIAHSADGKYANIVSITPLTEQGKSMFGVTGTVSQINPTTYFHLGMGFDSPNFKALTAGTKFLRDKIIQSAEGVAHTTAGGVFPEAIQTQGATAGAPAPQGKKLVMLDNAEFTYDQYKASGWTDDQIVQQGFAKWQEAVAPPQPLQPQAAPAPIPPVLPPTPAAAPVAPVEPVLGNHQLKTPDGKVLTMNDTTMVVNEWIVQGWTPETLVQHGHASFQ